MLNDLIDGLIAFVRDIEPVWRTLLAGLAIMLETSLFVGLVVPGDLVIIVAATAIASWGDWTALVVATIIGALVGESIGYAIGRWLGEPLRRSRLGRMLGEPRWRSAEDYLQRRGMVAVFVSRFLPVLHSLVPVTAGMARMPYARFMLATLPACALWALTYASVGAVATASYEQIGRHLSWAGYLFVAVIAVFALIVWAVRRRLSGRVGSGGAAVETRDTASAARDTADPTESEPGSAR